MFCNYKQNAEDDYPPSFYCFCRLQERLSCRPKFHRTIGMCSVCCGYISGSRLQKHKLYKLPNRSKHHGRHWINRMPYVLCTSMLSKEWFISVTKITCLFLRSRVRGLVSCCGNLRWESYVLVKGELPSWNYMSGYFHTHLRFDVVFYTLVCPQGTTLDTNAWKCVNCSVNTYKTSFGNKPCTPCPTYATTKGKVGQTENTCGKSPQETAWNALLKWKRILILTSHVK